MQPVDPSTIVRGPAALTMCRITRADSQPWQVRCPETKSSSYGTSLTPLIWGRAVATAMSSLSLFADADPMADIALGEVALGGGFGLLEDLGGHGLLDLAATQTGDEAHDDRALLLRVERGADLVVEDAAVVRRSEGVVAVDHADGLEAREALHELLGRERTEPLEPDETDLAALRAQAADRDLHRERERALTDDHHLGVLGHVLVEEGALATASEDPLEVGVGLADDRERLPHGVVVLAADLHQPVLVDLRRDGDGIVRVQEAVAEVELRQERVHRLLGRDLHDVLRVGEERAVQADRDRERDALVLADAPRHERQVQRFLRRLRPREEPAEVAAGERVVVLGAERARVVEGAVAADRDDRQAQARGDRDRLERVEPADAGGADEDTRPDGARVLHDLELAVLAVGDDVLDVHLARGDELRGGLHDAVVRTDRVRRHHVDVRETDRFGDGLAARCELLDLDLAAFALFGVDRHQSSPPVAGLPPTGAPAPAAFGSAGTPLIFSNHAL